MFRFSHRGLSPHLQRAHAGRTPVTGANALRAPLSSQSLALTGMSRQKIIGQPLPRPGALKLGDVAAIPLSDGRFGYGRQFREAALGILQITSEQLLPLKSVIGQQVAFFVSYC